MVRALDSQIRDTLKDIDDNVDRIHILRRKIDERVHNKNHVDPQDLGELVQRQVVTAHAAYQIAEVSRDEPDRAIGYRRMAAQLLSRAGGDLLYAGQIEQAERYFEDAAKMTEEIADEMREMQTKRREPSNAGSYHSRREHNRGRRSNVMPVRENVNVGYNAVVGIIMTGIIIMFLMGVPGVTGAVIGVSTKNAFGVIGIIIVLIGAGWLAWKQRK